MKQIFLFVAFSAFLVLVTSEDKKCPLPELVKPCRCTGEFYPIMYVCDNITQQDSMNTAFKNSLDYPMDALVLSHSSLLYLPVQLLQTKKISFLTISDTTMASLFDGTLSPSNKLENIILYKTNFQRGIEWRLIANTSPKIIQIERVEIKRVGLEFFHSIKPTLTQLTLYKTKTVSFHDKAFSKLTNLDHFDCTYNRIKVLKRSMFSSPSQMVYLDFTSNRITSLPDDMFENMPKLHTVYFDDNKLTIFTSTIWEKPYSRSLEEIHLLGNPFICDCSIIWFKKQSRQVTITGECKEPKNLKGRWLRDLSLKDFTYCPKAPSIQ
ncbi:uncharacterized protein TNIN_495281 [Trichonephila inaurata madagascariensis]|uniref:Uncharacterized protein n=1 Tax=Trichonephila inaurata madagascariensis TaxID=2747483 RepID=A0A8X7CHY8_9ARAC|nr:uncharacterized protein TNIN_495281 [Trichonephila inaurata madagascariensis]